MDKEKAKSFIYKNARPLDFARWNYLFENGNKETVLKILSFYQNEDGGFGHGLEPDYLNPQSSPVQTWVATEIIKEVQLDDVNHPIIEGILRYLASYKDFNGHTWNNTIPSNNDAPHAPWWTYNPNDVSYNPTASLLGFIMKYASVENELYQRASILVQEAYTFLKTHFPNNSMHTVYCFVELYEYLKESHIDNIIDLDEYKDLLKKQIRYVITYDTSLWSHEYVCKPSLYIHSKDSVFYNENKEICEFECDFISSSQQDDGTWSINWAWDDYLEQWHVSQNWWKSNLIIKNMLFYEAMKSL